MLALSFRSSSGHAEIDLLVSESASFETLKTRAVKIKLDKGTYYVACLDDLIEMKQKAGRPQDLIDIEILQRIKAQQQE